MPQKKKTLLPLFVLVNTNRLHTFVEFSAAPTHQLFICFPPCNWNRPTYLCLKLLASAWNRPFYLPCSQFLILLLFIPFFAPLFLILYALAFRLSAITLTTKIRRKKHAAPHTTHSFLWILMNTVFSYFRRAGKIVGSFLSRFSMQRAIRHTVSIDRQTRDVKAKTNKQHETLCKIPLILFFHERGHAAMLRLPPQQRVKGKGGKKKGSLSLYPCIGIYW